MILNLKSLFSADGSELLIEYSFDLPDFLYGTYNPLKSGVNVSGRAHSKADTVYLDVTVSFKFDGFCDRCAEQVSKDMSFKINKAVVEKLANEEDSDNYIVTDNDTVDLDALVQEEIILYLPSKILCKEDCRGLCYKCGKNLNLSDCDCAPDVDPRMSALLSLLNE